MLRQQRYSVLCAFHIIKLAHSHLWMQVSLKQLQLAAAAAVQAATM
jgi:hypothetical protein